MVAGREGVKGFVMHYFQSLGARIEEVEGDLYRIELDRQLAAELEGDAMPAWMWLSGPNQPAQITYYFTFTPAVAERFSEAELISPGSHRLQQVVESVRKIGRATRAHLPVDPALARGALVPQEICYRPFHVFCVRIEFHAARHASRLFCVAVDRVDMLPLSQLGELFPRLNLASGVPGDGEIPIEQAKAGIEASFGIAYRELLESLERTDPGWARMPLTRWNENASASLGISPIVSGTASM